MVLEQIANLSIGVIRFLGSSPSRSAKFGAFVYRLGQWVFSPLRAVRLRYALPYVNTFVAGLPIRSVTPSRNQV